MVTAIRPKDDFVKERENSGRTRQLYFGDNLGILRQMPSNYVALCCTDPPFNSGRNYNIVLGAMAQETAFKDTWKYDDAAFETRAEIAAYARDDTLDADYQNAYVNADNYLKGFDLVYGEPTRGSDAKLRAYLTFMAPRIVEIRRVLKADGSFYLHCDDAASAYLRGLCDAVFGRKQFRNEIVWQRHNAHSDGKQYGRIHDIIFLYTKSNKWIWNPVYTPYEDGYLERVYRREDERGRYTLGDLTASGITQHGESGKAWRGVNPSDVGNHWRAYRRKAWPEDVKPPDNYESMSVHEKLDALDAAGLVHWSRSGKPSFKRYLSTAKGIAVQDIISDIKALKRPKYPTEKPRELYERFIKASSNEGDIVLDPFGGGGTTIDAAETLKRGWIGIDLTVLSLEPIQKRMSERHHLNAFTDYPVKGYPVNMEEVRAMLAQGENSQRYKDFEQWAVTRLGLKPTRYVGDGGIDGIGTRLAWNADKLKEMELKSVAEVKSGQISVGVVRAFRTSLRDAEATIGILIGIHPISAGVKQELQKEGTYTHNGQEYPRLQYWQITDRYFENPASIALDLKLAWKPEPINQFKAHFADTQQDFLEK